MASGKMTRPGRAALAAAVLIPFVAALWKVEPPFADDALFEYYGRAIVHGTRLYVDLWDSSSRFGRPLPRFATRR